MNKTTNAFCSLIDTPYTYGVVTRFFHWLMAVLVVAQLTSGTLFEHIEQSPFFRTDMLFHQTMGSLILVLAWLRYLWAWAQKRPLLPVNVPFVLRWAGHITHGLLYACMLMLPLSGWLLVNAYGHAVTFFGYALPVLIDAQPGFASAVYVLHDVLAGALLTLIGLHVTAGLGYHYLWRRDDVLQRMLGVKTKIGG